MKEFAGYTVPNLTSEDFDDCVNVFNRNNSEVFCSYLGIGRCASSHCSECLLCANSGDAASKRQTFIAYAETKGYVFRDGKLVKAPSGMPELKPGMIVKTETGPYIICVTANFGYELFPNKGAIFFCDLRYISLKGIVTVYGDPDGRLLCLDYITEIVNNLGARFTLWKKPEAPRKLTVKEVAEKLGYPVEIVEEKEK